MKEERTLWGKALPDSSPVASFLAAFKASKLDATAAQSDFFERLTLNAQCLLMLTSPFQKPTRRQMTAI